MKKFRLKDFIKVYSSESVGGISITIGKKPYYIEKSSKGLVEIPGYKIVSEKDIAILSVKLAKYLGKELLPTDKGYQIIHNEDPMVRFLFMLLPGQKAIFVRKYMRNL